MRNLVKGRRLGRTASHRKSLFKNLLISLFRYGRIETTTAKAKELRPIAEKMITKARKDTVNNRRKIAEVITDKTILKKLFSDIAPKYVERNGGYIRIIKKGVRLSDSASISIIELV